MSWWSASAGGNLVLNDMMSAGALVSFMLYVASLNGAFQVRQNSPNQDTPMTIVKKAHPCMFWW